MKDMTCTDVRERLAELLYAELGEDDSAAAGAHIERCADCRAAWLECRSLASRLDRWEAPVPQGIAERVLATLAIKEAEAARAQRPAIAIPHLVAFLLAGAAAAGISLLLVAAGSHEAESPLKMGLVGALWTALYGLAGFLAQHGRSRRLVLAALTAAGLSILFAPLLSMPVVIEACRRWLEAAQASVALNVAILAAGALYAATPVFVSGAIVARARPGAIASQAAWLAGTYGLLLVPSVYLQCHPLPLALIAPWVAGVALGSWFGSLGGIWLAPRARPLAA